MARTSKPPRLYLVASSGRKPAWAIRHGTRMIRTGFAEHEQERALAALKRYLVEHWQAGWPAAETLIYRREEEATTRLAIIYFVTCDCADFPIKIGFARDVTRRLAKLQGSLPFRLVLLGQMPGTPEDERQLHLGFYQSRLRGEWFSRTPELMALIASLQPDRAGTAEARP